MLLFNKGQVGANMSYVGKTLADDEGIIERASFNWTYSFWSVVLFILGALPLAGSPMARQ